MGGDNHVIADQRLMTKDQSLQSVVIGLRSFLFRFICHFKSRVLQSRPMTMMKKNIALVGFMGAGKTVTSEILAGRLGLRRVSTDDAIIEKEGRSINDIFVDSGEPYFRKVEHAAVAALAGGGGLVIDCGGGVVLNPDNLASLKSNGVVIYLKTSSQVIYERVRQETHRPLLKVKDPQKKIEELLKQRDARYAQADYTVETDGKSPEQVAEEVVNIFKRHQTPDLPAG